VATPAGHKGSRLHSEPVRRSAFPVLPARRGGQSTAECGETIPIGSLWQGDRTPKICTPAGGCGELSVLDAHSMRTCAHGGNDREESTHVAGNPLHSPHPPRYPRPKRLCPHFVHIFTRARGSWTTAFEILAPYIDDVLQSSMCIPSCPEVSSLYGTLLLCCSNNAAWASTNHIAG
jgi:hypothetical protein